MYSASCPQHTVNTGQSSVAIVPPKTGSEQDTGTTGHLPGEASPKKRTSSANIIMSTAGDFLERIAMSGGRGHHQKRTEYATDADNHSNNSNNAGQNT